MISIKKTPLASGEFYNNVVKKDTICIHHTAGGHRPDWTINGWNTDKTKTGGKLPVATAYVIGGVSITDKNKEWDGVVLNCFDDKLWAHHLGLTTPNNKTLNAKTIGIEICNYGPLKLSRDGHYYNYVNKVVPEDMVVKLSKPFRGYLYYHRYSDNQISALKDLLIELGTKHAIDLKKGLQEKLLQGLKADAFEYNMGAVKGTAGLWTHTNYRKDKFDCSPQDNLISMINSL